MPLPRLDQSSMGLAIQAEHAFKNTSGILKAGGSRGILQPNLLGSLAPMHMMLVFHTWAVMVRETHHDAGANCCGENDAPAYVMQ